MGARPVPNGASFRVWAPFATAVHVAGDFNAWSETAHPLARESHGAYWSADVPNAAAGQQYLYVIRSGTGELLWKNDPYACETVHSDGNSVIVDMRFAWSAQESNYGMPSWDELVLYEIHAGTFNDQAGGGPGSFDSIIARLDYLRDALSVNAVLILPSAEFVGGNSLGYDPCHLFAIEREYGGPHAFQRFVRAAHERGIAVILDVVYNHMGPGDVDLKRFDGWWDGEHPDGIYFYDTARIATPWGGPRPDYGRPEVRQFLRDNALFWLESFHVDGLRFDGSNYIRTVDNDARHIPDGWSLMQWINDEVDGRFPWKLTIAEDMQDSPWITARTGAGGAGFDTQWDAHFVHAVRGLLAVPWDEQRSLGNLEEVIHGRFNGDALQRIVYTESHDESGVRSGNQRLAEAIWPGHAHSWQARKRGTLGSAIVMTVPGMPMLFQGQEFLPAGAFSQMEPLDWSRSERSAGLVLLHRDLVRLRRNWFNTTRGLRGQHVNVFHKNHADKVIAYHRWQGGGPRDDVVVVLNLSTRAFPAYELGFPREGAWRLRFNSDWNGYDPAFGNWPSNDAAAHSRPADRMPCSATVAIGPYSALIFSQD